MAKKTCNILIVILLAFAVDVYATDFRCMGDTVVPKTEVSGDTVKPAESQPAKAKPAKASRTNNKRVTFETFYSQASQCM